MSRWRGRNPEEAKMARSLDNLAVYEQLMPVIRQLAKTGGGAEAILKQSEILAALKMVELMSSEKPDVALRASVETLNRASGKPVERSISVYGDLNKMNERDLDSQIKKLLERAGTHKQLTTTVKTKKAMKVKQAEPTEFIDVTPVSHEPK